MSLRKKRLARPLCALLMFCASSAVQARAQDNINPRALEDIKAFVQKAEEGDSLFFKKQYADAAAALTAAHASYQRADRRDSSAGGYKVTLKTGTFPGLRQYGYGMGENASLTETASGAIEGSAAGFHAAMVHMWQDASILSNASKGPLAAFNDPPLVDLTEDQVDSMIAAIYGPVSSLQLPVQDNEWRDVVNWSRRAELIVSHVLQKYPGWKTSARRWSRNNNNLNMTGNEALADIKAKLAEAEPEYQKLVADFRKAAPARVAEVTRFAVENLTGAIAGVKRNGWLDWVLARDLYISNDYLVGPRKQIASLYAAEGKTMPAGALKPIEDKVAELKNVIQQTAPRWRFPAGKPRNAAIEARAKSAVMARFPGTKVLKTALDDSEWSIAKNELGIPRYRTRHVLVLVRFPGQKQPWLIMGNYDQTYTGGGTYSSSGTFSPPYSQVRLQSAD